MYMKTFHCCEQCTEDADFNQRSGSIRFLPGQSKSQSFTIPITDDQEMESDETLRMTFSSPGLPLGMVNVSTPTITIIDNDMGKCKSKSNLFASRTSNENKTQYCTPFHAVVGFDPTIGGSV